MKKKKFSDGQILSILKEYESGINARDLARKHGFYYQTLYEWEKRFSGVESTAELARFRDLESENARLKKMYANLSLEHEVLKDVLSKKVVTPAQKRKVEAYLKVHYPLGIWQVCRLVGLAKSSYYYRKKAKDDTILITELHQLALDHPAYGFKKMYHSLRNQGYDWNHKKVYRVYKALGLNLTRKRKRRLPPRARYPLSSPSQINQVWSMDFMSDALYHGSRFRTLNIIDDYNREALWIAVSLSIDAKYMVELLTGMLKQRGKPGLIRVDNGPEFTSSIFSHWCDGHQIQIRYIQPGKPVQNAFLERFNRSYRAEVLDRHVFRSIIQAKEATQKWREHYTTKRPHESLGNLSPQQYQEYPIKCVG